MLTAPQTVYCKLASFTMALILSKLAFAVGKIDKMEEYFAQEGG